MICSSLAVALAVVALTVSSATAQTMVREGQLPPPEFDVPYRGTLIIWRTESIKQNGKLRAAFQFGMGKLENTDVGLAAVAFAQHHSLEYCEIFIVKDEVLKALGGYSLALILRHELGHCNGWRGHERGKWVRDATMPELPPGTRWLTTTFLNGGPP